MWSFGHYSLRLPIDWLSHYTFAEYTLLCERWKDEQAHQEYRASLIAVVNVNKNLPASDQMSWDHCMRPQFRTTPTEHKEPYVIPKLTSTVEELKACFGPDFNLATGGAS